ncbi:MAG TPA: class I SAM-dependent methyltransferase, partial [Candidatus Paceibacterota bacterium]|nr:class I SAM-dependent methyltransferase [Candidatus Paceibacterota bacterium]
MKRALKKIIPAPLWKRLSMFRKRFMLEYRIDGRGERLDMSLRRLPPFEAMSVYERSHFRRYEFACQFVKKGDLCGDFACGTGYGTAMLADKGKGALGIDIDKRVVRDVRKRYADRANVAFRHQDLLDLSLREELDAVVSFETIEHFHEKDIPKLFANFSRALRPGGLFIFST